MGTEIPGDGERERGGGRTITLHCHNQNDLRSMRAAMRAVLMFHSLP